MFEKDANLHASIMAWDEDVDTWETIAERSFQKGAEFGYNKANEWHYVKEGKPKDNECVLIYTDIKNVYIARLVEDDYFITNKGGFVQMSAVIAWKEIVLPKESE